MGSAVSPMLSRLRGLLLMAPLLGAAACVCLAAAAAAEEPMLFDVLRDGSKIGEHRLVFEQEDGALKVSVETDMTVDFAFVTVFRYEHKRVERWRDGALDSLAGMTNDDGPEYGLPIVRQAGHYSRTINGTQDTRTGTVAAHSHWSKHRLAAGQRFAATPDKEPIRKE